MILKYSRTYGYLSFSKMGVFALLQQKETSIMAIEQVVEDLNLHVVPAVQTSYHKKLKSTHAFIGDVILFKRKGFLIQGIVVSYRPESVIVEIDIKDAKK